MAYTVKTRSEIYKENATVNPSDFGGWLCVNSGTGSVQVLKTTLAPGEGLDFTSLNPDVLWDTPIPIVILEAGGEVTLHRLIYKAK